jgi:hypothetical protein
VVSLNKRTFQETIMSNENKRDVDPVKRFQELHQRILGEPIHAQRVQEEALRNQHGPFPGTGRQQQTSTSKTTKRGRGTERKSGVNQRMMADARGHETHLTRTAGKDN